MNERKPTNLDSLIGEAQMHENRKQNGDFPTCHQQAFLYFRKQGLGMHNGHQGGLVP